MSEAAQHTPEASVKFGSHVIARQAASADSIRAYCKSESSDAAMGPSSRKVRKCCFERPWEKGNGR